MRVVIYNLYHVNSFVTNTTDYAKALEWKAQNSKNKFKVFLREYVEPETKEEREKRLKTIEARMIAIHG